MKRGVVVRLVVVMACLMVGVMLGLSSYVHSVGACSPTEYGVWIPAPVITSTAVFPMPPSVRETWYRKYVIVAAESSGCGEPEALCAGGTIEGQLISELHLCACVLTGGLLQSRREGAAAVAQHGAVGQEQ